MASKETLEHVEQLALVSYLLHKNAERLRDGIDARTEPTERAASRVRSIVASAEKLSRSLKLLDRGSDAHRLASDLNTEAMNLADELSKGAVALVDAGESDACRMAADVCNAALELADALAKGARALRLELGMPILDRDATGRVTLKQAAEVETACGNAVCDSATCDPCSQREIFGKAVTA